MAKKDAESKEPKAAPEAGAEAAAEPKAAPDPRLKVMKKFHGKFLPKGPLRERHKEIMKRWNAGEDHGGVTLEELKSLHADWRATKQKPGAAQV